MSVVFRCKVRDAKNIKRGDDAKSVVVIPMSKVLSLELAFDHRAILTDYIRDFHPHILQPKSNKTSSLTHRNKF